MSLHNVGHTDSQSDGKNRCS